MSPVWRVAPHTVLLPLLVSAAVTAVPLVAQESPHARLPEADETFCGQVFLRSGGQIFGHEFVEFRYDADVATRPAVVRDLAAEPASADRMAYWWRVSPDSIGAYMSGEDATVWELRLTPASTALQGTLRQVVPEDSDPAVADAYTMVTPCRNDRP